MPTTGIAFANDTLNKTPTAIGHVSTFQLAEYLHVSMQRKLVDGSARSARS